MALALLALLLASPAGDEVFSGPQVGDPTPGFKVLVLSGPRSGQEVDWVAEWKGAPTVLCFIHELTRPGAQLMRKLDAYGQRNREALRTLFVALAEDPNQAERNLPRSIRALNLQSLVGVSPEGAEGPGAYGLNKKVLLTVLIAREGRVTGNWALVSPNETDFPPIQAALDRLLEPSLDTLEALRKEVLRLRGEISSLREELDSLRRERGGRDMARGAQEKPARGAAMEKEKAREGRPLVGKAPEDSQLETLFRKLIRLDATPEQVEETARQIEARVEEKPDLKGQVVDAVDLLDHLGYGNEASRAARKKLKEKYGR